MTFLSSLIIGATITVASSAITTSQSTPLSRSPFRQNVQKQKPTVGREPYCPSKEERGSFCPEREPKVSEAHGCTQLMRAAESGRLGEVRALLVSKVNVPAKFRDGDQALMLAAGGGHPEIVTVLLAADADPNAIFATNHDFGTAWMAAMNRCNKNWLEILDAMIAAGVKVNPKSDIYFSPLGYAISKQKDTAMIEELLKRGGEVNIRDSETGETLLIFATKYSSSEVLKALIDAGADLNARNNDGKTALTIAEGYSGNGWQREIVLLLKKAGANR